MTKEEVKKAAEIMLAYVNGKEIEMHKQLCYSNITYITTIFSNTKES